MLEHEEEDRFDLEQAIMNVWATADDLDLLARNIIDGDGEYADPDTLANTLIGLQHLHVLRSKRLLDIFERLIERGDIE